MADSDNELGGENNRNNGGEDEEEAVELNLRRTMEEVLPAHANITLEKEAVEAMRVCMTDLIQYTTKVYANKVKEMKRNTIKGDDLSHFMETLRFVFIGEGESADVPSSSQSNNVLGSRDKIDGTGGSASSSLSQPTGVPGEGVNVGGTSLPYGTGTCDDGAESGGMMDMSLQGMTWMQFLLSPEISGTGTDGADGGDSGKMAANQHFGSQPPTYGSLNQNQQGQMMSGLLPGGTDIMASGQYLYDEAPSYISYLHQQHQMGRGSFQGYNNSSMTLGHEGYAPRYASQQHYNHCHGTTNQHPQHQMTSGFYLGGTGHGRGVMVGVPQLSGQSSASGSSHQHQMGRGSFQGYNSSSMTLGHEGYAPQYASQQYYDHCHGTTNQHPQHQMTTRFSLGGTGHGRGMMVGVPQLYGQSSASGSSHQHQMGSDLLPHNQQSLYDLSGLPNEFGELPQNQPPQHQMNTYMTQGGGGSGSGMFTSPMLPQNMQQQMGSGSQGDISGGRSSDSSMSRAR